MGSVKRRGGSSSAGGTGTSSRSKGNARFKERRYDDGRDDISMSKTSRNKNRFARRTGGSASPTPDGSSSSRRRRIIDPTVLARGMSSRAVGARVSSHLPILSSEDVERDLRHMEAYANACTTYAQQFFIFHNRALVNSGHFGPISGPGGLAPDHHHHHGYHGGAGGYGEGGQYSLQNRQGGRGGSFIGGRGVGASQFAMPVRIDPEEEKRVAMLRKRIAASEAQREELETEYMSLRAHYVQKSHELRRKRHTMDGELKMLQDLVRRRGEVLAIRRVRVAMARDILTCLDRRNKVLGDGASTNASQIVSESKDAMEGIELTTEECNKENSKELADIWDVWQEIENKLRDAEQDCTNTKIPEDLSMVKSETLNGSMFRKREDAPGTSGGGAKKKIRRGSDDVTGNKSTSSDKKHENNKDKTDDDIAVPWESQIMPRTPYGVPIYMSYLSSVADRTAAYGGSSLFGCKKSSLTWLESNVPETYVSQESENQELIRLREETRFLEQELNKERNSNKELQQQIIMGKNRNDEISSMMGILRCETEAVLNRHNILLDTPEARSATLALHSQSIEVRDQPGGDLEEDEMEEEEEGEIDETVQPPDEVKPEGTFIQEGQMALNGGDGKGQVSNTDKGKLAEDNDNDGDDEGEIGEDDEEDGEIVEGEPPKEVIFGGNEQGNSNM